MKVVGIVAEFNPFHNGHKYIIEQAKTLSGADYCVVVMSGDFVQNGTPAICSKELRCKMALLSGADLVLMLPVSVSTASAEGFSEGAIALLDALGCVDTLCFGSESVNLELMEGIADILLCEPEDYKISLKRGLAAGMAFPAAREKAVIDYIKSPTCQPNLYQKLPGFIPSQEDVSHLLSSPNSILGIEYLKAIKRLGSDIKPLPVIRKGVNHLEENIKSDESFCSATALRTLIKNCSSAEDITSILPSYVPENILSIYKDNLFKSFPVLEANLSSWLTHLIMSSSPETLMKISDCDASLTNAISGCLFNLNEMDASWDSIISLLTTKNYTKRRISRVLLHALLGIKRDDILEFKAHHYCLYARILGFCSGSTPLLHKIKTTSKIPLISKLADKENALRWYQDDEKISRTALRMLDQDILAGNQYSLLQKELYGCPVLHEMQKNIVKV